MVQKVPGWIMLVGAAVLVVAIIISVVNQEPSLGTVIAGLVGVAVLIVGVIVNSSMNKGFYQQNADRGTFSSTPLLRAQNDYSGWLGKRDRAAYDMSTASL